MNILLIDDSHQEFQIILLFCRHIDPNIRVHWCANLNQGINFISVVPNLDLVLLDIHGTGIFDWQEDCKKLKVKNLVLVSGISIPVSKDVRFIEKDNIRQFLVAEHESYMKVKLV